MSEHQHISAPATAESEGEYLFVSLDEDHHDHPHEHHGEHHHHHGHPHPTLTFFGTYTTPTNGDDERPLEAKGTITFERSEKFAEGDRGHFTVTKKKDGSEYDVEVVVKYHKNHAGAIVEAQAVFKGKGNLREGAGTGEWKLITRNKEK